MASRAFKRSLFGYSRSAVHEAIAWRDAALKEETARGNAEKARAGQALTRAAELERASLDLAGRLNGLEQVADRLALRVVDRERQITTLNARLEAALDALREALEGRAPAAEVDMASSDGEVTEEASARGAEADIFAGLVEVEVGPLSDFGQLASFEDAAAEILAAKRICVKRFTEGRATLELDLSEPVALLSELEERAPFEFTVRDTRERRVVLDIDAQ